MPTTGDARGLVRAGNVPPSNLYYVVFPHQGGSLPYAFTDAAASPGPTLDAAHLTQERLHPALASGGTSVDLTATGLSPWQDGDYLYLEDLDVQAGDGPSMQGNLFPGDTTSTHSVSWTGTPSSTPARATRCSWCRSGPSPERRRQGHQPRGRRSSCQLIMVDGQANHSRWPCPRWAPAPPGPCR